MNTTNRTQRSGLAAALTAWGALAFVLGGCQEKRTQIMLGIATDFRSTDPMRAVQLQVFNLDRPDQLPVIENTWPISFNRAQPFELPGSFGLHAEDGDKRPRMRIVLSGLDGGGKPLLTRTAIVSLVKEKTLFMRMGLVLACTTNADCRADETCVEARCKTPEVDSATLPEFTEALVTTVSCTNDSGTTYRNTSSGGALSMSGPGQCAADEFCIEGTCYKRPSTDKAGFDLAVSGRVVDSAGVPVAGATVVARDGSIDGPALGAGAVSDSMGQFRVLGTVPPGGTEALIHVFQQGFVPQILPVPVKTDQPSYRLPVTLPALTETLVGAAETRIMASPTITLTLAAGANATSVRHAVINPVFGPGRLRAERAEASSALQSVGMLFFDVLRDGVQVEDVPVAINIPLPMGPPIAGAGAYRAYRLNRQGSWTDAGPIQASETGISFTALGSGFWDVNRSFPVACARGRLRHSAGGCRGARVISGSTAAGFSGFDSTDTEGGFCITGAPSFTSELRVGATMRMVTLPAGAGSCGDPTACMDLGDLPIDQSECIVPATMAPAGPSGQRRVGESCSATELCAPGSICYNKFCVGSGALRVSLSFTADTDLDLYLQTPSGKVISFINKVSDGGKLDVDQCAEPCGTSEHVENIVFENQAPSGAYQIWVANFEARNAADFKIDVAGSVTQSFTGMIPKTGTGMSAKFTFQNP